MVKAIVFDIGGVLIGLDTQRCIKAFEEGLGFSRITELLDPCHQKGIYGDMEAGNVTAGEFVSYVISESRPGVTPQDVKNAMAALLTDMPEGVADTVKRLAEKYPLYLLSNNNSISMSHIYRIMENSGIIHDEVFRDEFLSYRMNLLKPSVEIYDEAARRTGFAADGLLFIDDNLKNVEAARAAGWQARHYVPGTSLAGLLEDL